MTDRTLSKPTLSSEVVAKRSSKAKRDRRSVYACGCVAKVNEQFKARNSAIEVGMTMNFSSGTQGDCLLVQTYKLNSKAKGKACPLFASFCPFCGVSYAD